MAKVFALFRGQFEVKIKGKLGVQIRTSPGVLTAIVCAVRTRSKYSPIVFICL